MVFHLVVPDEDSSIATTSGWTGRAIPGATVTVHRDRSSDSTLVGTSDASGTLTFGPLLVGTYTVGALRVLDSLERSVLDSAHRDVDALAGNAGIVLDTPGVIRTIVMPAGHRGSLVFSEYWFPTQLTATDWYPEGGFVELYNNSDTTIYLDGKIFADGLLANPSISTTSSNSCTNFTSYMNDPDGVWAEKIFQFPGTGADHPIRPGQAVVLATDAVNHQAVFPNGEDLSHADFEFVGLGDVDNPAVPNMIQLSVRQLPLGHGWMALSTHSGPLLAEFVDLDTLPSAVLYTTQLRYYRIPRAAFISMMTTLWTGGAPKCSPLVSPLFDGAFASIPDGDYYAPSLQRFVRRILPDGRRVLQNTRNSAQDFQPLFPRSPGSTP